MRSLVFITNDLVLFPNSEIRFEIDSTFDKHFFNLVNESSSKEVLIVNSLDNSTFPDVTMLPNIGVLAKLNFFMDIPNGKCKITLMGLNRVNISDYQVFDNENIYTGKYNIINEKIVVDPNLKSLLIKSLRKYVDTLPYVSNAVLSKIDLIDSLNDLTDLIISFLPFEFSKKANYISEIDCVKRCKMLLKDMNIDLKYARLEEKIDKEVSDKIDKSQKEFYLREKINAINKELGEDNNIASENDRLKNSIKKLKAPKNIKDRANLELNRFLTTPTQSPESSIIRDYLDWLINLPWNKFTKDNNDFNDVSMHFNDSHYGLTKVKERILEYLAVKQNTNSLKSPIICLVGPPGVGKTTLAMSIGEALNRNITKISVGGVSDEAEIVGHRRTYIASCPGRIIEGLRKANSMNPLFIIDEIDKMTRDIKGDPASSLLEVLDPNQNTHFLDHYIDEDVDLSKVMFIATANYIDRIPYELLDRLEIIEIPSYTEYEKKDICKNYIIPKALESVNLTMLNVSFTDDAILDIIRYYTKEAGVRELERKIEEILRKIVKKLLTDKSLVSYVVDSNMVLELLGNKKYNFNKTLKNKTPGIVNGMAYTEFGGDILPIEANYFEGTGRLILTGNLGDVMKESCEIALSYIKANKNSYGINIDFNKIDIHIHVPEGAIPKDGPSAGSAITTVLISLFKGIPVSNNIAMTGEITLTGSVLPIGGLREKLIGALRSGITTIFVPSSNQNDINELDNKLTSSLKINYVSKYDDIYKKIFRG